MTKPIYEHSVKRYTLSCKNPSCESHTLCPDGITDWLDLHGRGEFWIDTPCETYSGVYNIRAHIMHGTFEYYNREKICCSFCNEAADITDAEPVNYTTTNPDNPFFNLP